MLLVTVTVQNDSRRPLMCSEQNAARVLSLSVLVMELTQKVRNSAMQPRFELRSSDPKVYLPV